MKYLVVSIRDIRTGYSAPQFELNEETAERNFAQAMCSNDYFRNFAKDFALFSLGIFDDQKATFELEPVPSLLLEATDALRWKGGDNRVSDTV